MATGDCDPNDPNACHFDWRYGFCVADNSTHGTCLCDSYASTTLNCSIHNQDAAGGAWLAHVTCLATFGTMCLYICIVILLDMIVRKSSWKATMPAVFVTVAVICRAYWPFVQPSSFAGNLFKKWIDYLGGDCLIFYVYACLSVLVLHVHGQYNASVRTDRGLSRRLKIATIIVAVAIFGFEVFCVFFDHFYGYAASFSSLMIYWYVDIAILQLGILGLLIAVIWLSAILHRQSKQTHRRGSGKSVQMIIFAVLIVVSVEGVTGLFGWNTVNQVYMDVLSGEGYAKYYNIERAFELLTVISMFVKCGVRFGEAFTFSWSPTCNKHLHDGGQKRTDTDTDNTATTTATSRGHGKQSKSSTNQDAKYSDDEKDSESHSEKDKCAEVTDLHLSNVAVSNADAEDDDDDDVVSTANSEDDGDGVATSK
jgi:hypothetical protein